MERGQGRAADARRDRERAGARREPRRGLDPHERARAADGFSHRPRALQRAPPPRLRPARHPRPRR